MNRAARQTRRALWMSRVWTTLRILGSTVIVVGLYFVAPFDDVHNVSAAAALFLSVVALVALMTWQVRAIVDSPEPRLRAIEALAVSIPLLIVSFATIHFMIEQGDGSAYTEPLNRMDSLYFSVTVLSTVGFGDISPVSQTARIVTTLQMVIDLLVLGIGVRVIGGAVAAGRERAASAQPATDDVATVEDTLEQSRPPTGAP